MYIASLSLSPYIYIYIYIYSLVPRRAELAAAADVGDDLRMSRSFLFEVSAFGMCILLAS